MNNIYLPINSVSQYACYVIQDKDTIRAYYSTPRQNSTSVYTDFFINSHYLKRDGTQTWGNTSVLPSCIPNSMITTEYYYSVYFDRALFIFLMLFIIIIYFPYRLMRRILGRWFVV